MVPGALFLAGGSALCLEAPFTNGRHVSPPLTHPRPLEQLRSWKERLSAKTRWRTCQGVTRAIP
jgi:hypothetical protein